MALISQDYPKLLAERNNIYHAGYKAFDPTKQCVSPLPPQQHYYYKLGWHKAASEYEAWQMEQAQEHCPYCGSVMEELANIDRCTNITECGHHTHK